MFDSCDLLTDWLRDWYHTGWLINTQTDFLTADWVLGRLTYWLTDWLTAWPPIDLTDLQSGQAYAKEKWKDKKTKGKKDSMTDSLTKELLKFDLTLILNASQINGMDHTLKLSSLSVCSSNHISEKCYRVRTYAQTPLYLYCLGFWLTYWMVNFETRWLTGRTPDWTSNLLMTDWLII